jgi:hypothetical protein
MEEKNHGITRIYRHKPRAGPTPGMGWLHLITSLLEALRALVSATSACGVVPNHKVPQVKPFSREPNGIQLCSRLKIRKRSNQPCFAEFLAYVAGSDRINDSFHTNWFSQVVVQLLNSLSKTKGLR